MMNPNAKQVRPPIGRGVTSTNLSRAEKDFVIKCVEEVVATLCIYGFDATGYRLKGTIQHWLKCAELAGDVVKYVKWKSAAYYAHHKGQELPPCPGQLTTEIDRPWLLLGGRAYKFINKLQREYSGWCQYTRHEPGLWESWITNMLSLKKGCPRPDKSYVAKAVKKSYETLTSPVVPKPDGWLKSWGDIADRMGDSDIFLNRQTFTAQLKRTVDEVFCDAKYTLDDRIKPFFPSTSANYIRSRSGGGAVGELKEKYPGLFPECSNELIRQVKWTYGTRESVPMDFRAIDDSGLRAAFQKLYNNIADAALLETPYAEPLGLAEALKVRVISKGPALTYTALKPLQKFLWSTMKKQSTFELIGKPISHWILQDRLGAKLLPGEKYLSVDYSDATNQMALWVSQALVELISDKIQLSHNERILFRKGLTEHIITYDGQEAPQRRGQLMGSVVSFPLLCLANATILRWTRELQLCRTLTLDAARILVNGDDGVLRTTAEGRWIWERIASFAGLEPSVGKVYFSDSFLNMNSVSYLAIPEDRQPLVKFTRPDGAVALRAQRFSSVRTVNRGLFLGMGRSSADDVNPSTGLESIGSKCRDMVLWSHPIVQVRLLELFIRKRKKELIEAKLPWFLPEELGGLGLPILDPSSMHPAWSDKLSLQPTSRNLPKDIDLRLARKIHDHPEKFRMPVRPASDFWITWKVATSYAAEIGIDCSQTVCGHFASVLKQHEGSNYASSVQTKSLKDVMALCVVSAFMLKPFKDLVKQELPKGKNERKLSFQELLQSKKATVMRNHLRACSRLYIDALHDKEIPLPEPYSVHNFPAKPFSYDAQSSFLVPTALQVHRSADFFVESSLTSIFDNVAVDQRPFLPYEQSCSEPNYHQLQGEFGLLETMAVDAF